MDSKSLYSGQDKSLAATIPDRPSARDTAVIAAIRAHLHATPAPAIAELLVGDGTLSVALQRAFPTADLTFVDISRPHLDALARLIPAGRGTFVEADLDRDFDRLASGAFDVVIALDILEHVFDVFAFVGHLRRILRPGGALYLRVPNVAYAKHRLTLLAGQLPVTASWFGRRGELAAWRTTYGWDGGHLHYFTLDTLRALLTGAGLQCVEFADPGARFAQLRRLAPSLLCGNLFVVARPAGSASGS